MLVRTYCSLVFTMLLWGGTFIAGRILAGSVTPVDSAFLRFFIASTALIPVALITEKKLPFPPVKCWIPLILLGMTGVFAYNICFFLWTAAYYSRKGGAYHRFNPTCYNHLCSTVPQRKTHPNKNLRRTLLSHRRNPRDK